MIRHNKKLVVVSRRFASLSRQLLALVILCALLSGIYSYTRGRVSQTAYAATGINHQINFQGKLVNTNGTNVTNGSYSVVFSIYSVSSGGVAIWTETQTPTVTDGIFQVNLGSVTALPGSVDFNTDNIYLGIKVGADAEMTPRIQFTAVPQAFNSEKLGGLDKTAFAPASGANYLAKNTNDTSSFSFLGNLLGLTNTNAGAAGVLGLTNAGTGSALNVTQTGNPSANQALIFANNTNATPSGNLIDLQALSASKFSVSAAGAVTAASTITGTTLNATTGLNTGAGAGTLRISNTGVLSNVSLNNTNAVTADANIITSGTLAVARGGTGLSSYTTGDLLFASASGTLASLADAAANNVLLSGGVGVAPSYGKVVLGTHTTGNYVATIGTLTGLTATGNTGAGSTPTLAVNYGSAANNAAAGANTFICPSGTGNLSGGGTTVTIGTSGTTCGALNTVASPSFTTVTSTQATGTAPLTVSSTTKVTNLNADLLDGFDSTAFQAAGTYAPGTAASYIQNQNASPQAGATFNIAGTGTAATFNATTGINTGAGAGTQRIDASGNLVNIGNANIGNKQIISTTRTVPTVIDSTVDIGSFGSLYSHSIRATIAVVDGGFSVTKSYVFASYYDQTAGVWKVVPALSDTGAYAGQNFQLEAKQTLDVLTLRIRRSAGATAGTARITINYEGDPATVFTPSSTTASGVAAVTALYPNSSITQTAGFVGIGTLTPGQALDVQGGDINTSANLRTGGTLRISNTGVLSNVSLNNTNAVTADANIITSGTLAVARGGTGVGTTPTNGQLLIGNGSTYTVASLGATGLTVTPGAGTLSLAVNYGSAANNAAAGANTFICPSGTGNLSGGGTTVTIGTSGTTCGALNTVASPSFTTVTSTQATGTAPLTVSSTTKVTNLNADLLDGFDSTAFQAAGTYAPGTAASYIQNQNASPQAGATFNIAGTGTAATFNATTGINTGAGAGTQRIDASGNLVNIGTISASGNITTAGSLIEKSVTFTPTTVGWYRISSGLNKMGGTVRINTTAQYDGTYTDVELQYNISGYTVGGSIQETRYSSYNNGAVSQARISSDGGGNVYLDIYVSTATSPQPITILGYGREQPAFVTSPVVGAVAGSSDVNVLTLGHGFRSTKGANFAETSGNVGIGIANPGAKLTIRTGATDPGTADDNKALFVTGSFGTGQSYDGGVEFRHDNLTQGIGFGYNTIYAAGANANQDLNLISKGTSPITLNAYGGVTGGVGIGTATVNNKLTVAGSSDISGFLRVGGNTGGSGVAGDIVARRTANTGAYYFGDSASNYLYFDGTNYNFGTGGVVTSGLINGQTINTTANFTGTLTVAGATTLNGTLTVAGVSKFNAPIIEGSAAVKTFRNLATFNSSDSVAGAIVIQTSVPMTSNVMTKVKIEGYLYDATAPFSVEVSGFWFQDGNWYNRGYVNIGSKKVTVSFGKNTATGNVVIILGDVTTIFNLTQMSVTSFMESWTAPNDAHGSGWTISKENNLAAYDTIATVPDTTAIPASQVTAGTFGAGAFTFNGGLTVSGANTLTVGTGATSLGGTLGVTGAITGSSTIQGTQLISTVSTGTAPLSVASSTMVSNLNSNYLGGLTEGTLGENLRAQANLSGGGTISWTSNNLSWTTRLIVISNSNLYTDINMPANGTVITGVGGAANVTVTAAGIPLTAWQAVYFVPATLTYRVAYLSSPINSTSGWILIAVYNGDNGSLRLGTGLTLLSGQTSTNGVVNNAQFNTSATSPLFVSTVATGTAPLTVASTTKVTNLNADLLDGLDSAAFQAAGTYAPGTAASYIQNTTVQQASSNFNISGAGVIGTTLTVGATTPVSNALISAVANGNAIEFGHTNAAGYRSTLGAQASDGAPFVAFNAEAGTTANTYRTRGVAGSILKSNLAGGFLFGNAPTASADNQAFVQSASLTAAGNFSAAGDITASGGDLTLTSTSTINAGGAQSTWGALTVNGTKNSYGGINFRNGATNLGTLMVDANNQGFINDADNAWDWYFSNGVLTVGTVPAANVSAGTFGVGAYTFPSTVSAVTGYKINGAATTGTYLRGDGTNFVQSAILAGDLPTGSGNYIQNQSALQATSNFHISGTGTADTSLSTPLLTTASGDLLIDPAGDTVIRGSVAGTSALVVQNSGSAVMFNVRNDGNIGIGNASAGSVRIYVTSGGNTSGTAALSVNNSSAASLLYVRDDGNVGIGTATPAYKLDVAGSINTTGSLLFNGATNNGAILSTAAGSLNIRTGSTDLRIDSNNAGATLLTVANSGATTINSSSAGAIGLTVTTSAQATPLKIKSTSANDGTLAFQMGANSNTENTILSFNGAENASKNFAIAGVGLGNISQFKVGADTSLFNGNVGVGGAANAAGFTNSSVLTVRRNVAVGDKGVLELSGTHNNINSTLGTVAFLQGSTQVAAINGTTGQGSVGYGSLTFFTNNIGGFLERAKIDESGNVLLNENVTSGTTQLDLGASGGTFAVCHTGTNNQTNDVVLSDCTGTPAADYMEMYSVESGIETGEIVAPSSTMVTTKDGETVSKLTKTTTAYQNNVIGIVSDKSKAGDFNSVGHNINDADNPMPVALNGRVPVKIAADSEPIMPGDFITTSATTGRAMKATRAGQMIGKALEAWAPNTGKDTVMIFVTTSYADPVDHSIQGSAGNAEYTSLNVSGAATVGGLTVTGTTTTKDLTVTGVATIENLKVVDSITTADLTVTGIATIEKLIVKDAEVTGSLTVKGGITTALAKKSADYTATLSDSIITANASDADFTVTLPTAVGIAGRQFTIKKVDSSSHAAIIKTTGIPSADGQTTIYQTIDGAETYSLNSQYKYIVVVSDGTNWIIVGNN